jgi:hypothetical protein
MGGESLPCPIFKVYYYLWFKANISFFHGPFFRQVTLTEKFRTLFEVTMVVLLFYCKKRDFNEC